MYEDKQQVLPSDGLRLVRPRVRRAPSRQNGLRVSPVIARAVVEHTVALVFEVSAGDLRAPTRGRAPVAFARQVAMYLMHVACGQSMSDIGSHFGRDRTTVAHACGLIEDRRDEPVFDLSLEQLESAIVGLAQAVSDQQPTAGP